MAVEDHIQRERPTQLLDQTNCRDLASIGRSAGDTVGEGWLVGLNADLYVVEAHGLELFRPPGREAEGARNEVGIQTQLAGAGYKLDKVAALERLTA